MLASDCGDLARCATDLDVGHVLAMRVLPQVLRGTDNDIDTVNTSLNSDLDIVHVTSDVSQDLGLQAELANGLAVLAGLLACAGAGELNAVNTKFIQLLGNCNLHVGVKVGIGELLTLTKGRFNDLEVGDVGEEVADWLVWVLVLGLPV